ncbi:MAG: UTP--glucose-1-phosphate uridylyltransferase [Planctomycetota bacterium]
MNESRSSLFEKLRAAGQEHVLRFADELSPEARQRLENQVRQLDLDLLAKLGREEVDVPDWEALARRSTPPPAFRLDDSNSDVTPEQARRRGEQALREGKVAAILVAGGQGSRLGFDHPKGMFPIGPVSGHSLFQILIERVLATARRYQASVPLFVMTSPATHDETVAYLDANDRFGMSTEDLIIFCQGTMPAVDANTGGILLSDTDSLALAPDGHGGMLAALHNSGALDEARERGIEVFSYGQIDNPLVQICQPELVGYHLLADSEMTTQVIEKQDPLDKVGNVVMVDGQMRIIEYSDLPEDVANMRNPDGSLWIWAGSIAVHVFDRAFLERMAGQADALPFHQAVKKVTYVDESGNRQRPEQPNAIKFERFIFDLLPWASNAIVVEGNPCEVFAPVKNADEADVDTPTTARNAMIQLHAKWLRLAGATVLESVAVEISPLWALDEQQVRERARLPLVIKQPTFFH